MFKYPQFFSWAGVYWRWPIFIEFSTNKPPPLQIRDSVIGDDTCTLSDFIYNSSTRFWHAGGNTDLGPAAHAWLAILVWYFPLCHCQFFLLCFLFQRRFAYEHPDLPDRVEDEEDGSSMVKTSGPRSKCGSRLGRSSGVIHGGHQVGLRMFFFLNIWLYDELIILRYMMHTIEMESALSAAVCSKSFHGRHSKAYRAPTNSCAATTSNHNALRSMGDLVWRSSGSHVR